MCAEGGGVFLCALPREECLKILRRGKGKKWAQLARSMSALGKRRCDLESHNSFPGGAGGGFRNISKKSVGKGGGLFLPDSSVVEGWEFLQSTVGPNVRRWVGVMSSQCETYHGFDGTRAVIVSRNTFGAFHLEPPVITA